ncbi:hypothetical protein PMI42_04835 [Bradyrhizobium sp. YR681]|uniref:hypothetical protein n=1 Tax=Bradyrhizobium sp. YR681 TaxID=1144344 RepID=UPI0002710D29|nr:hypothetical protein [Bradyrhizobium sp. YR681]EJN11821.1 hypothetical protein PMI42_04835 [Bradyrhizobium sp. YR681]
MSDTEWYPADWVDETCPPAKKAPAEYIVPIETGFELGYVRTGDAAAAKFAAHYNTIYNQPLSLGDVVDFISCERLGDVDVTLRRDGTYVLHGTLPRVYNALIVDGDIDTLCDSFEEMTRRIQGRGWDELGTLLLTDVDERRMSMSFANWSDPVPYLFEIVDGKPVFTPVPVAKQ